MTCDKYHRCMRAIEHKSTDDVDPFILAAGLHVCPRCNAKYINTSFFGASPHGNKIKGKVSNQSVERSVCCCKHSAPHQNRK